MKYLYSLMFPGIIGFHIGSHPSDSRRYSEKFPCQIREQHYFHTESVSKSTSNFHFFVFLRSSISLSWCSKQKTKKYKPIYSSSFNNLSVEKRFSFRILFLMAKRLVNVDVALDVFFCTVLSTAQQKCLNKSLANKQANKKKKQKQNKETNKKPPWNYKL